MAWNVWIRTALLALWLVPGCIHAQLALTRPTLPAGCTTPDTYPSWHTFDCSGMFDTTYNPPTGGTTWTVTDDASFRNALTNSVPGDVISVQATITLANAPYHLPLKANPNHKWIYIQSGAYSRLPAPGTRVSPADAANMPTLAETNGGPLIEYDDGANYWRLVGLHLAAQSNKPTGCTAGGLGGANNCFTLNLVAPTNYPPAIMPDHIVVDRSYLHGTDDIHVGQGINIKASNFGVVDSYIANIHKNGEAQAIIADVAPGPIKIVNNYLEGAGENVFFGCGGRNNTIIPSDILMKDNLIQKPLTWIPFTNQLSVKNLVEFKDAQRVLMYNNTLQNSWIGVGGQHGTGIVMTVRSGQSGDNAVVNDMAIVSNHLNNVVLGMGGLGADDDCGPGGGTPTCHNPGSQDRWYIAYNLITHYDPNASHGSNAVDDIAFPTGVDRVNGTSVFHVSPTPGFAGTGYVVNCQVQINGGKTPATLKVTAVDGSGAVTALGIITNGAGYSRGSGFGTTNISRCGTGSGLQVTIPDNGLYKVATMRDVVYIHNTSIPGGTTTACRSLANFSISYSYCSGWPTEITNNVWLLDNVSCGQHSGDCGNPIASYMGNPKASGIALSDRFAGNVMVNTGMNQAGYPVTNKVTASSNLVFDGNYNLTAPAWQGTDGLQPGYISPPHPTGTGRRLRLWVHCDAAN